MRSRLGDESGLAERILVGIVAWAFASVAKTVAAAMVSSAMARRAGAPRGPNVMIDVSVRWVASA